MRHTIGVYGLRNLRPVGLKGELLVDLTGVGLVRIRLSEVALIDDITAAIGDALGNLRGLDLSEILGGLLGGSANAQGALALAGDTGGEELPAAETTWIGQLLGALTLENSNIRLALSVELLESVLAAADAYYTERESKKDFSEKKRRLEGLLAGRRKKEEKKLAILSERERSCSDMEKNRLFGELITANIYALRRGADACELVNYYDENANTVRIPLEKTLDPAQNAQKYYKKYNKQKRTLAAIAPQKQEALSDLDYTESMLFSLARAENALDLAEIEEELRGAGLLPPIKSKGAKAQNIPFRTFTIGKFRIFAGRNNVQNDRLLREAAPSDIWLHTRDFAGGYVIIKAQKGKTVPLPVLLDAASLAIHYSKAKKNGKADLYYTEVKYLRRAKDGKTGLFAIRNEEKTVGAIAASSNIDKLSKTDIEYLCQLSAQTSITTQRANSYAQVLKYATLDALTGLNNRRQFEIRLKQEVSNARRNKKPLCCIMLDIDYFKKVNDTWGHSAGDCILKNVARIISHELREYDIASRYGGEEFCILLPDTKLQEAAFVAQRLRTAVEKANINISEDEVLGVDTLKVTISVGVSEFNKNCDIPERLHQSADVALYEAKRRGRNRVVVYDESLE